jgi:hypothetical protein
MSSSTPDAGAIDSALDSTAETISGSGARLVQNVDHRLTLLMVRMTMVSLSFFFACFYFAQIYLQLLNQNNLWLPKGINHPASAYGVIETGCLLLAGLIYFWGQWAGLYRGELARLRLALWAGFLLTVISFAVHIIELHNSGFSLQGGGYVSVFVATEGTFTALLFFSCLAFFGMANRARLGLFNRGGIAVEAFGEYYGWLSAIALINFLALYVQPFFPSAG